MHRAILALIIVVYAGLGVLYAVRTPKWQAPDEPAHFNYVRAISDTGELPVLARGDYNQAYLEQIKAAKFPPSMTVDSIRYESYQPPLYYVSAVPIYLAARAGGVGAEVLALRLYSVGLEIIVLLLAYLILREIFPADRVIALATVGLMATIPMHVAMTAAINSDTAVELVLALILLLSIRRVQNKVSDRRYVLFGGFLFGAALLLKLTAYAPGAALLAGAEFAHQSLDPVQTAEKVSRLKRYIGQMAPLFLLALVIALPMFIRNILTYGARDPLVFAWHDTVVAGQPTTAEMVRQYGLNHILFDFLTVTFKSFWAQFGWMGVLVNDRIYVILFVLTGIALLGLTGYVVGIWRGRSGLTRAQLSCIGLLALLVGTGVVDYIGYNFRFLQLQGRYLFPAIIAIAFLLVTGIRELVSREYERPALGLLYFGLVGLDIACLFLYIVPQLRI